MKLFRILTMLLMFSLALGFYSCSKEEEVQDEQLQEETTEENGEETADQNKDEASGDISKEEFMNYANEIKDYLQSDAFITEIRAMVKEAIDNPDMAADPNMVMQKGMQEKMMEMGKKYGIENEAQMQAAAEQFKDDPDYQALEKEMQGIAMNAMMKLMSDQELLDMLPEDQRKQMQQAAEMMKGMQESEAKGE